ncbi:MAG: hypothetical protein JJU45_14820 [Acidimicrobiia bacterium]|nr:hypothetical protein [Acidimicrobiia bacterium]
MEDLMAVVRGDDVVGDRDGLASFVLLVPLVEAAVDHPEGAAAIEAAQRVIERMPANTVVASVLDWWFVVTTGRKSPTGHAFTKPDGIDDDVWHAMEQARDLSVPSPVAGWTKARRRLTRALGRLDDDLLLDSYGASKLPEERQVWAELIEDHRVGIEQLRRGVPGLVFELDETQYRKSMKRAGIDANSRRWREMTKRANQLVERLSTTAELVSQVRPQEHPVEPPILEGLPASLVEQLAPLGTLLLAAVLPLEFEAAQPDDSEVLADLTRAAE